MRAALHGSEAPTEWLWHEVNERLGRWLPRLFGYHLVAIGEHAKSVDLSTSPIHHRCIFAADGQVHALAEELPFAEHAVDVVVLPLVLHHSRDPHQVMREAYRVLIPGGHLVIVQPNPVSLFAAACLFSGRLRHAPWRGGWISSWRLKEWLKLLACEVIHEERLCFGSLLGQTPPSPRLEYWGRRLCPAFGGFEIIVACKRELPLTPIRMPRRNHKKVAGRAALAPQARFERK